MLPTTRRGNGGWSPFGDVLTLRRDMQDLLENLNSGSGSVVWAPPMNVREDAEAVVIEVELPGVKPDEVDIRVENGLLTISGEKHTESESREHNWHVVERRHGRFERGLTLSRAVDVDSIRADFADGVLRITLPKPEEAKPRRIQVNAGGRSAGQG